MRRISFSMTESQIRDRSKTVTRRQGWRFLRAGDLLQGVEKAMGLKPGEKQVKLAVIRVVDVRREPVDAITHEDVVREGFPTLSPPEFVDLYCEAMGCGPFDDCTRIEFEYVDQMDDESIDAGGSR
jgi:hypothetical protein